MRFAHTYYGEYAFIDVYFLSLPIGKETPGFVPVQIIWGQNTSIFLATRLEGGQRLILPKEAEDLIIKELLACNHLHISVGRFQAEISSRGFLQALKFYLLH